MPGSFILSDLAAVFNTNEFATAATIQGVGTIVNGIFDNETVELDRDDNRKSLGREATFQCPESSGIAIGSNLTINGVTYTVRYPDYDGTGVVKWYLEKWRT